MKRKNWTLIGISSALAVLVFSQGPLPQDPRYHDFADQRVLLGLPNAYNVLSNALLILTGAWGGVFALRLPRTGADAGLSFQYALFFTGVFLSGLGSCYYHYAPSNQTLLWDRLPMALAFTALMASVVSECISRRAGALLLPPALLFGVFSVLYWFWTEQTGRGDLRPYVLVQFLPVVLIPLILALYGPPKRYAAPLWSLTALYLLAKVFEMFDQEVFVFTQGLSGHSVKHLVAALATGVMLRMLYMNTVTGTRGRKDGEGFSKES